MQTLLKLTAVAVAAMAVGTCVADEPREEQSASFWMKKKLEYSEKILAGLANEDFEAIGKTARSIAALNQMEKWVRAGVPEYRAQLQIFQTANRQLIEMAEQRNLDGAALAYVQLTLSCVNCHKVVRHGAQASTKPPQ